MKRLMVLSGAGVLLSVFLLTALWVYSDQSLRKLERENSQLRTYRRHYVMISQEHSALWEEVFEAVRARAQETDASADWIASGSPVEYTTADCLRIAAASGVDGILLHKEAGEDVSELIGEAAQRNIPVVTLLSDEPDSRRVSFVGINSYEVGEAYAQQVLSVMKRGKNRVMVLSGRPEQDPGFGLTYSQMLQGIEAGRGPDREIELFAREVNTQTGFDAEEDIRDIFIHPEQIPDIMVCLDPICTECVRQALIDYNKVGSVAVIGYYASDNTLDAVRKGIVKATFGIDGERIGRLGVDALNEYWSQGRVSDYFSVGFSMITKSDLPQEKDSRAEEGTGSTGAVSAQEIKAEE